jgi:hypothetical protein
MTPESGMIERVKRIWCWVQRPAHYEVSGCPNGHTDCEWSEWQGMLWCPVCEIDFVPEDSGIFGGPVPVNCAAILAFDLRGCNLETGEIRNV